MPIRACLSLLLALLCCDVAAGQERVTLAASRDNTLYEDAGGSLSNGSGDHFFAGRTGKNFIRRALVAFDLRDALPDGAVLDSVQLTLHVSRTEAGPQPVSLHRALAPWGEGASNAEVNEGAGGPAAGGDATWLHTFFDSLRWGAPGGDFVQAASATRSVEGNSSYTWGSTVGLVGDVQAWLDDPSRNFGWLLRGNEGTTGTAKRFDSREHEEAAFRPTLTLYYTMRPVTATEPDLPVRAGRLHAYPNPSAATTTIAYELERPGLVELAVYDVLGRRVATLVRSRQGAGPHRVRFDATPLPEGVYVFRLATGGTATTGMLVVLR